MNEKGEFDLEKARETGAVDLLKKVEIKEQIDFITKNKEITYKIEMLSNQDARKEVADYLGMKQAPRTNDADIASDFRLNLAARFVREIVVDYKLPLEAALNEFFERIKPELKPVRELVEQKLLSESVS